MYVAACGNNCDVNNTESNPRCSTNLSATGAVLENDAITIACNVTYSGIWAPVMSWMHLGTGQYFPDDDIITTTTETKVTSQLTVTASAGFGKYKIKCHTNFAEPLPSLPTNAANIPSYSYTWTSPSVNVHCKTQALRCSEFLFCFCIHTEYWKYIYRVAQKSKTIPKYKKIVLNRIKFCQWA